jgi:signal transduction histidine kinase
MLDMSAPSVPTTGLDMPLPTRQFRGFLLLFHAVFLGGLIITFVAHLRQISRPPGINEAVLGILVTFQILLYLVFFAIPSLTSWQSWKWFHRILVSVGAPPTQTQGRSLRHWWWIYIAVNVAVVLAECRLQPSYAWSLIAYVGQISALPLRESIAGSTLIFTAFLLNHFGLRRLIAWDAGDWFSAFIQAGPLLAVILFLGRTVATSGERGRLILELETAKLELEQARQHDADLAVLQERERLARDLHDCLGHSLATLTVQLEAVLRLISSDPARAKTMIAEMQKLTRTSMEDLRRSLANLRATGLGERPLTDALQDLCSNASQRSGLSVECDLADGADRLPPIVSEVIWRVAQEALTNAEKHAQARRVQVSLSMPPSAVRLQVRDDGIGFPPDAESKPGHYGLRGLRERVEGLGGTLTMTTLGSQGASIEVQIPVIA